MFYSSALRLDNLSSASAGKVIDHHRDTDTSRTTTVISGSFSITASASQFREIEFKIQGRYTEISKL